MHYNGPEAEELTLVPSYAQIIGCKWLGYPILEAYRAIRMAHQTEYTLFSETEHTLEMISRGR